MAEFRVIPFTLDMWSFSTQQLAERYFDKDFLQYHKVAGLSRVYSVTFYRDTDDDMDDYDEDTEMGSYHHTEDEFYMMSPSYKEVVNYIRENTCCEAEAEIFMDKITDRLALVFETK